MNLIYYKADIGNFGDDLNPWLWERIFGDFSQYSDEYDFIGIGSMLWKKNETPGKKIIFGAGVRDFLYNPEYEEGTDVLFLRGPISSKVFGGAPYITDAAYCLALLEKKAYKKKYKLSYMPYFRHATSLNWKLFEKLTGIKIIYPTNSVEQIIQEINESERLLTSAMHGAIVADIYRIPWNRVQFDSVPFESHITSEIKWYDWTKSMNIENISPIIMGFNLYGSEEKNIIKWMKYLIIYFKLKSKRFYLSEESVYNEKIAQLKEKVEYFKDKYSKK